MTTKSEVVFLKKMEELRAASIQTILKNQSKTGAYIASPNFKVYNYSWFRDGAFIADAMLDSGQINSAQLFHSWVANIIVQRKNKIHELIARKERGESIPPDEHLHCRYTSDGHEAHESWTNFQLDGFGTWLWTLDRYLAAGHKLHAIQHEAATIIIDYLNTFWMEPSFDWWEESFGHQHISTLGSIAIGLQSASHWEFIGQENAAKAGIVSKEIKNYILNKGVHDGRLTKWANGDGLDASVSALIAPFNLFNDSPELSVQTVMAVDQSLGRLGTYRHKDDVYFGGGRWIILSAFLALAHVEVGNIDQAKEILEWITEMADENLNLPEQISSPLLHPEFREEWITNWGEPALPLLWSHAMFLKLLSTIEEKERKVSQC
jgi:GH15 family glucan-1,4-alpha-glucosidase